MSAVLVQGRAALAEMLRLLAKQVEDGSLDHPFSIQPAPHLGPQCVRVGGVDYDMAADLPGVIPEHVEDETPATVPGKGRR